MARKKKKKKVSNPLAAWQTPPRLPATSKKKAPAAVSIPDFLQPQKPKKDMVKLRAAAAKASKLENIPLGKAIKKRPKEFYHILVVHGKVKGSRGFPWVHHCLNAIKRFTTSPYKIHLFNWCGTSFPGVKLYRPNAKFSKWAKKFNMHRSYVGYQHQVALTYMATFINDGWLTTLDTDAFPLAPGWEKKMSGKAGPNGVCGLGRRLIRYPALSKVAHPSCMVTPINLYKGLGTTFFGTGSKGDVGVRITAAARKQKKKIALITRTNSFKGLNSLGGGGSSYFAVHGNFIYHHSCGSRMAKTGAIASSGTHTWPRWVLNLDNKIKKLLSTNFAKFTEFVKKGQR